MLWGNVSQQAAKRFRIYQVKFKLPIDNDLSVFVLLMRSLESRACWTNFNNWHLYHWYRKHEISANFRCVFYLSIILVSQIINLMSIPSGPRHMKTEKIPLHHLQVPIPRGQFPFPLSIAVYAVRYHAIICLFCLLLVVSDSISGWHLTRLAALSTRKGLIWRIRTSAVSGTYCDNRIYEAIGLSSHYTYISW